MYGYDKIAAAGFVNHYNDKLKCFVKIDSLLRGIESKVVYGAYEGTTYVTIRFLFTRKISRKCAPGMRNRK